MKLYLPTALALACIVLAISLVLMKHGDDAQHENDTSALLDLSNQVTSVQAQIAAGNGTMLTLSNNLDECRSAALALSNRLMGAEASVVLDYREQITNLNQQLAAAESQNQALDQRAMDLTNQITSLTRQITLTETNLARASKDYALLENRLRIDVGERVVAERKFNNLSELEAQTKNLKQHPAREISAGRIYAGLDVEVKSNAFHVIAPN